MPREPCEGETSVFVTDLLPLPLWLPLMVCMSERCPLAPGSGAGAAGHSAGRMACLQMARSGCEVRNNQT